MAGDPQGFVAITDRFRREPKVSPFSRAQPVNVLIGVEEVEGDVETVQ